MGKSKHAGGEVFGREAAAWLRAALALEVKRRAAHYRSDKKLADADVVAAGGNAGRAERLRAEAGVMLQQDLARSGLGP